MGHIIHVIRWCNNVCFSLFYSFFILKMLKTKLSKENSDIIVNWLWFIENVMNNLEIDKGNW